MDTYATLEIDFNKPEKGDPFNSPVAQIFVKSHTVNSRGNICLTPLSMSFTDFEEQITRLESELKELRNKAKQHFER